MESSTMTRFSLAVLLVAAAASAFFAVPYFDLDSSYTGALAGIVSLSAVSALLVMVVQRPREKSSGNAETTEQVVTRAIPTENQDPVSRQPAITRPIAETVTRPAPDGRSNRPDLERATQSAPGRQIPARPRGYMGDQTASQVSSDYMRKRLAQPDETLTPKSDQAPLLATIGDVKLTRETTNQVTERRPDTGTFTPFDEHIEPEHLDLVNQIERPSFQESANLGTRPVDPESYPLSPDSVTHDPHTTPTESEVSELHSASPDPRLGETEPDTTQSEIAPRKSRDTTDEITVNIEKASQALQRRLPTALDYYRREGVSSAIWAGVATSVVVSAVLWQLTRNERP